jgi:MFS family permease
MRRRLPPVLQQRDYALLWSTLLVTALGTQMTAVAVGWQVYGIHRSAFDLGLIGLAEFVPLPLLALPAGHLADRFPRRLVVAASLVVEGAVPALLLVVTISGVHELWPYLALALATGAASALGTPAARALFPELVQPDLLAGAMALRSIAGQAAVVGGAGLGGLRF